MSIIAIDQGTTSTRALLMDESGEGRIVETRAHRQRYPHPGWVEHDPEELIDHIRLCIARCIEQCDSVSAIGVDNQGESCLAWHADSKEAITPVIVWQDSRSRETIERLRAQGARQIVAERAGVPLDPYFSASKLGWIMAQVPAAQSLHRRGKLRLGTTDAFFLDRLTGRFETDITTASRTALLNLRTGQWDQELCDLFGVPLDALPRIVASSGDFGALKAGGKSIPVTASIVDQQASLYGHGCRAPGDAKITFGTGAFALALAAERPVHATAQGLLATVAWQFPGQAPAYALEGGVHCAGAAINWGRSIGLFQSFDQINHFSQPSAAQRDVFFVPALSGLACPHWDRRAAGLWIGLSLDTQPLDLIQSILEGIAFRAGEVVRAMRAFTRVERAISIDGGVSANPYFCQFLANVIDAEVAVPQRSELTAHGTAQLAGGGRIQARADGPRRRYQPTENMTPYTEKFTRAVERAAQWLP